MKRPAWLMKVAKGLWFITKLPKKFPIITNISSIISRLPLIEKILDYTPLKDDLVFTLPKDQVIQMNQSLEMQGETVLPSQIVEYFIRKAKHHFIMKVCLCRYSNDCKDYPKDFGCMFMGDALLNINTKLGRFVTAEEALDFAEKCREAGLVHLIGRAYPDRIGLGATPPNKLLTICNCCPCCCGLSIFKHLPAQLGRTYGKMPGVEVRVHKDKCVGCGTCMKNVCFIDAIQIINKKAAIDQSVCRCCGRCILACPQEAIELIISDENFIQNAINEISSRVEV
ncbi:MAG: 4Fe-4S ferredoxin [Candidatus Helarchaeota archaeon]|nr:4Fe-4S ferredoxin [Candidatus Helarchaeota archaeon]